MKVSPLLRRLMAFLYELVHTIPVRNKKSFIQLLTTSLPSKAMRPPTSDVFLLFYTTYFVNGQCLQDLGLAGQVCTLTLPQLSAMWMQSFDKSSEHASIDLKSHVGRQYTRQNMVLFRRCVSSKLPERSRSWVSHPTFVFPSS